MQNTKFSSRSTRQPSFGRALWKWILLSLGRLLVSTGGRAQVWGAQLIERAARNEVTEQTSFAHALLLASLIIALILGVGHYATQAFGEPSGPVVMRARSF